jgi:hypothetical protein
LKLHFSILFLLISIAGFAQSTDSIVVKLDTVRNKYLPTGIRIGTDVIALIKSSRQDNFKGWEVNADVDFNRYNLALDYGAWGRDFSSDSATYSNDGRYWRAGVDVNFLLKDVDRNMFFIGFRYGKSKFSEQMSIISDDDVWGTLTESYNNPEVKSHWLELTSGIKVKMYKFIWMGYTARFKFGLKSTGQLEMLSHDVPGYGRTDKETAWGFNYQIFFRIPLRPTPPPLRNP